MDHFSYPLVLPTYLGVALLAVWLFLFVTGREQLKRVTRATELLVLQCARAEMTRDPKLTLGAFFRLFLPRWRDMLRRTAWYVTHKTELFPILARPELVIKRIGLDENYVGKILVKNQIALAGYEFKRVQKNVAQHERKPRNT